MLSHARVTTLVLCAISGSALAADVYVAPTGDDANPGTAAMPMATIDAAVAAAAAGDTVHLAPGTYEGDEHRGHDIDFDLTFVGDGPRGSVVVSGADGTISFSNPALASGRFMAVTDADVTLENITFDQLNLFDEPGPPGHGVVANMTGGSLHMIGCDFTENRVQTVGGAYGGIVYARDADVSIDDCTFVGNILDGMTATGVLSIMGTVVQMQDGDLTINDSLVDSNTAGSTFHVTRPGSVLVTSSTFRENGFVGPVIHIVNNATGSEHAEVTILDTFFDRNGNAPSFSESTSAACLRTSGDVSLTIGRSIFFGNVGSAHGSSSGDTCRAVPAVLDQLGGETFVFDSVFAKNAVHSDCFVDDDQAPAGVAIVDRGSIHLVNCTVAGHIIAFSVNSTSESRPASFTAENTVFADNHTIVHTEDFADIAYASSVASDGATGQLGLTIADPMVRDMPANPVTFDELDLRLEPGSPAIDGGNNAYLTGFPVDEDIDGNARVVDGNGDGTATVDAGAYEYQGVVTCGPADITGDGYLNNADINAFVANFIANNPAADINNDGAFNNTDINLFVAAFLAGCA